MKDDPQGLIARGYRFTVRGDSATWRHPSSAKPGDIDVTDIEDTDELAAIFVRERDRDGVHQSESRVERGTIH